MAISDDAKRDYVTSSWTPGTAITQAKMENIETGIYVNREAIQALDTLATDTATAVSSKLDQTQVDARITQQLSGITQDTSLGRDAMTQIANATTAAEPAYANLNTRFQASETLIKNLREALGQVYDAETGTNKDIYTSTNTVSTILANITASVGALREQVFSAESIGINPTTGIANSTMSQHMNQIDIQISNLNSSMNTILSATGVDEQGHEVSMSTRIQQLVAIQEEINAAHRAVEEGASPDTLNARFTAIESSLSSLIGNVNDNYVKKSDVKDNFTSSDTNLPLSAAKGKELRDMIGGTYDSANTVTGAINTAATTAETNAKNYADTNKVDKANIYNDLNYVPAQDATDNKVLDARQGKALKDLIDGMDTAYKAADTALDGRLTAAEGAITTLNGSGEGSVINTVNTQIAAVVADAPDAFDTLKEIADWIDTHSDSALEMQQNITDNADAIAALQSDLNTDNTGIKARVTALETSVNNETTGLAATKTIADSAKSIAEANQTAIGDNTSGLTKRVKDLEDEPKSATEIVATLPQTGDATKDYLVGPNEDGKYFYYKWINNAWNLISGGSGEGNTSGMDLTAEEYDALEEHDENTDYYVTRADGVHHYRFVPIEDIESGETILTEVEIGQFIDINKIKRYNIATSTGTVDNEEVTYLNLYQYDYNEISNAIDTEREPFTQIILPRGGGGSTSTSVNKLTRIGDQTIQKIVDSQVLLRVFYSSWDSDGAESSAGTYTLTTGNTVVSSGTLNSGAQVVDLSLGWQDNTPGFYEFDVTDYCAVGNTVFHLSVTVNGTTLGKDWTVNIIDLHLESDAPEVLLINAADSYNFPYTAFGALTKTLHIIIDDNTENEITQSLSSVTSGRAAYAVIPAQEHGAHKIEMYLTATIGGVEQTTSSVIREYIWYDTENTEEPLILASPKNGQTITAQQYSTIEVPYQVYKKNATSIKVDYYADNSLFDSITLEDTNTGTLSYLATNQGAHTLKIMVDNDEDSALIINLNITELDIDVAPVAGAIIDFDPTMLTNSSTNRLPSWTVGSNTYSLIASDNFNWSEDSSGGGYKTDADGKAFVIKAGSYIDLNYPMFARNGNSNILTNGAEMKIIFKVGAVRNVNAVWYKNIGTLTEKTVGIQLGAHSGWLKTDKATDTSIAATNNDYPTWASGTTYAIDDIVIYKDTIYKCIAAVDVENAETDPKTLSDNWLSMGKIETEVLATNSYLYMPYSEEDKIELDININKYDATAETNFIMSYEDGVPSKAYAYEYGAAGDGLYHDNTIRIGSDDCDIYIYHLRIYNKSLSTSDILQNFIADGNGITEKVERYNRNCIYWDSTQEKYFTSPSTTAVLDPIKLAEVMPDVKVLMLDTPVFTVGKKNFVQGSSLRCIHADGGNVYKSRGDADNWLFINGFHAGQGTTSDNYGQSARNVDFLFEVDGKNYPTKKKNMSGYTPSSDYVSKVYIGENASTWNGTTWEPAREATDIETCDNWKGDKCKISLTETSVPNNYFNLKVNVASSENVNNALFQKRYDDFLVYNAPAQTTQIAKHRAAYAALGLNPNQIKVKNSMEFVPAVLFVRENDADLTKHTEFADTNWHFYALGNIGDSKKTDYTRAYDPDDMNEFTCENSDNNTNNGQFQSGVFIYQGVRAIETPYEAYDSEKTYKANDIVVNNGIIQIYNGTIWSNATLTNWTDSETPYFAPYTAPNTMQYLFPITSSEWNVQVNGEYVNYKHYTLVNEEFDGDHSFEFRYACRGDYRDGDLINESEGQDDDAQFDLNHGVMLAFYEWLITSTPEQYVAEASQWFVKSAMEFFYAYTHYYTMMDNRAKNTFWHFAKTGTYIEVTRPVKELLHVYEESTDGGNTWVQATGIEIDPDKKYRTQYAFDLWAYDMDTAAGIDNNGALVFPYGKEDGDYRTEGDPSSGYAFNGAGSIFWRRLKSTFDSEIRDVMTSTDRNCFNSENLINEFDTYQNCYPEEIWRLDIERKYIRTFTGKSVDSSVTTGKQNPRFLTSMMQGRKKYQRRQWIRNQGVYFNSKYRLPDIIDNSNTNEFNCTTPADIENIALTPSYRLQLTPYQDMYLNVQVGNGNYKDSYITLDGSKNLRAKAGQTYTFDLSGNYQETRIYINGANHLSEIGNLAPMYPYSFDLRALAHIKTLNIGTDVNDYTNTKFTELKLPTFMPLLETLNIKNCHSVAGTISLATANNIRTVEAMGTSISGISLPDYTSIETLHIPSTVTALNLYSARFLNDFKVYNSAGENDYSSLYKLHIYDSDYSSEVDWIDIASAILSKQSLQTELSLLKLSTATIGDIQELEPFNEFKSTLEENGGILEFDGTIHITGAWSEIERDNYMTTWPNLRFDVSEGTMVTKHRVDFKYDDYEDENGETIEGAVIKTMFINHGDQIVDIWQYTDPDTQTVVHILDEMPSRNHTVRYNYQFGERLYGEYVEFSGWKLENSTVPISSTGATVANGGAPVVTADMTIETYFKPSYRTYPIKWYLNKNNDGTPRESTLVKTSSNPVNYGDGYSEEAPTVTDIHNAGLQTASATISGGSVTYSIFSGWEKLPTNITPTIDDDSYNIFATWNTDTVALVDLFADTSELTPVQLLALSAMNSSQKTTYVADKLDVSSQFTYTMGHDSIKSGIEIIGPNSTIPVLRLDLSTTSPLVTSIQPMREDNDAFTIAVDYCFNENATYNSRYSAAILMSCYYIDSSANTKCGFALFDSRSDTLGAGPRVGFGDMFSTSSQSKPVGSTSTRSQRNIVVLRHPAGSSTLYIYSGFDNNITLSSSVVSQQIPWSALTSPAYLNFGQLTNSTGTEYASDKNAVTRASGTVYWAKYWPEDLGVGECKRIAAWPHENMTFAFADIGNDATSGDRAGSSIPAPSLEITTITTSAHGKIVQPIADQTDGAITGWGTSIARTICNERVFPGLPTELQAIMCKSGIYYRNMLASQDSQTYATSYTLTNAEFDRSYVYFPSAVNLGTANDYLLEETNENLIPYEWYENSNSVKVYDYDPNVTGKWTEVTGNTKAQYYNLRFEGFPITWASDSPLRVFRINGTDISSSTTIYTEINAIGGGILEGDVFIDSTGQAYQYVSSTAITQKGAQNQPNSGLFTTDAGGWISSDSYWTRSMGYNASRNKYVYVETDGGLTLSNTNNASANGLNINYSFGI